MFDILFSSPAVWFTVPALAGTLVFALRLALLLIGGDSGMDVDTGGGDAGHGTALAEVLSFQTLAAFAMGAGWAGLAALLAGGWGVVLAGLAAAVGGALAAAVLIFLFRNVRRLTADGTARIDSSVGTEADVYLSIPEKDKGRGQVRAVVSGRLRVLNAVSTGPAIGANSRVLVVRANDDNSVVVQPI